VFVIALFPVCFEVNSLLKFLYHRVIDGASRWYPFLGIYYLTYRCGFRCPYCADGANQPYYDKPEEHVPGDTALRILAGMRRHCKHLVITGGEPLEHEDVGSVLNGLPALGYKTVALNTNGDEVSHYLPAIAAGVHRLVFSLDTLDAVKADAWFGRGPGTLQRILENIEAAANYPGRSYEIVISAVVTPNNIEDLYDVFDYASSRGFVLAVCPELQGVRAPEKLLRSEEYRQLIDFLIARKEKGAAVFGSRLYLEHMRDFRDFRCHPFTLLTVSPRGEIYYPCLELGHRAANILEQPDLHGLRVAAQGAFGAPPACRSQCHSACSLGFSLMIEKPLSMIGERP
jgi:MoaA/NifB/PqqE/SkfB family radical SAM enzyme